MYTATSEMCMTSAQATGVRTQASRAERRSVARKGVHRARTVCKASAVPGESVVPTAQVAKPKRNRPIARVVPSSVASELTLAPTSAAERLKDSQVKRFEMEEGTLYVGMNNYCTSVKPGNGGLRVRSYDTAEEAESEAQALCDAMTLKHAAYNTGFTGAKLVFDSKVDVSTLNKNKLMKEVARTLASEAGCVYTGCDINTTEGDMEYLDSISPFVLAGIGSTVDTNKATADGTFAAVVRMAEKLKLPKDFKIFIQGCGKVGTFLAESLVKYGATVYTADVAEERANIKGCINMCHVEDFAALEVDIFSPNAIAGVVTVDVAKRLKAKAIVGAANVPFRSEEARTIAADRGIFFVPEYITSAGAIIVDSMEWCHDDWATLRPSVAYAFCYDMVYAKVGEYLDMCDEAAGDPSMSADWNDITVSVCEPSESVPVGSKLREWIGCATEHRDVVVIGAGMAGTAAAYQLSKLAPGTTGVVLEAGEKPAHRKGSSFGDSRMFRQMYSDPYFSELQSKSLGLWSELEAECGTKLLDVNGLLFYGAADTGETVEGSIPGALEVMEKRGLPHKFFEKGEDMKKAYSSMSPKEDHIGLLEETAGSINSSLACEEMMRMAEASGDWKLRTNARVLDVWQEEGSEKYHVLTSSGTIFVTDKLVCCAGAWTNNILGHLGVELDMEVWKVHWGHYKLKEGKQSPQWFHFGKDDGLFYGFPGKDGIAKVGVDFSPDKDRFASMEEYEADTDESLAQQIDGFVKEQWGETYAERVDMVTSPYTMTKDAMFVLDTVPEHPNVSVFSAGNGRAFKFGPMLGRALANLVMGDEPSFDIAPMTMRRDGLIKSQQKVPPIPATPIAAAAPAASTSAETKQDSFGRAHVPFGEVGAAQYSKLTVGCFDVVMNTKDLIDESVKALNLPADSTRNIRLADFGAADGGPEMPMVHYLKSLLPPGCDLEVCFEDQPNNDFTSLFYLALGIEESPVPFPPLSSDPGIFFSAIGRSFFDQCLPKNSVDISTSFTAVHWLSEYPTEIRGSVHQTLSTDAPANERFSAQASKDWDTYLKHRTTELRKGGQGVVAAFGVSPSGSYLGWNGEAGSANMYGELNGCWDEMLAAGQISATEHANATFCSYYRSEEEMRAGFTGERLGLRLKSLEWRPITCPFGRGLGSPAELVGTVRTWSNSTFESALDDVRAPEEKKALVDHLYEKYRLRIEAEPERHHMDYMHAYLHFEKC
mmetsp:Transcript_14851/g.25137  ORF Transcript_14851/g.25137 Transcript_14851/m.25137 type:complete len:1221 (+) Transcript_14851:276-3938(+)|eukprot:CAMPEP_0198213236 /NCGR_PEP_ID=MMETSP1445-20131203/28750_1 /TAXON_ID=36898 /ORGANISM="Pyramimonas sp., Strain CCMP2087" /LENGTH=1220 /DNA_ID=CAMNT_0043887855 /DNA_START=213 /DNA_END=3875 /DNA_ORIENTATION=-